MLATRIACRRCTCPARRARIQNLRLGDTWRRADVDHTAVYLRSAHVSAKKRSESTKTNLETKTLLRDRIAAISKVFADLDNLSETAVHGSDGLDKPPEVMLSSEDAATTKRHASLSRQRKESSIYTELKSSTSSLLDLEGSLAQLDEAEASEMRQDLLVELDDVYSRAKEFLTSLWLSEPVDVNSAYIDIRPGSGGTEACDWAAMLARMYTKWAYSRNYSVDIVNESPGDVTGIKATTLLIQGAYAYGYAQFETGVHRLVRISPFDQARARHTSFASVRVSPHFDEESQEIGIELNPADLRITTMRSQGAGGQHVNKTESAVRVVHIPTGMTVLCQQERSQHRNRLVALSLLKSKLYDMELKERANSKAQAHQTLPENAWGSQFRSYVLHPYQRIKDSRTGYEIGSGGVQRVLDGDLGGFLEASLRKFRCRPS